MLKYFLTPFFFWKKSMHIFPDFRKLCGKYISEERLVFLLLPKKPPLFCRWSPTECGTNACGIIRTPLLTDLERWCASNSRKPTQVIPMNRRKVSAALRTKRVTFLMSPSRWPGPQWVPLKKLNKNNCTNFDFVILGSCKIL